MKITKHGKKFAITYRIPGYTKTFTEAFPTEAEAKLRAAEVEYSKSRGTLKPPAKREKQGNVTLSEFLDKYVATYGVSKWGDSYYSMSVHRIEDYVKPYLGDRLVKDIDAQDLSSFYAQLATEPAVVLPGHQEVKTVSLPVIEKIHCLLRSAFSQAVAWGLISSNPATNATYPKGERAKRAVWDRETALDAIENCKSEQLKMAMLLAIGCSLRLGEILGLTWENVQLSEDSMLYVTQELKRCDKTSLEKLSAVKREGVYLKFPEEKADGKTVLVLKKPKTDSSIRRVFIPSTVAQALAEHKALQETEKERLHGLYQDYGLVIAQPNGRPMETRMMDRLFQELIQQRGYPKVVFHSLRHLSTSEKLKISGGDIKAVQGDNGQSQAAMVTDVYSHICDGDRVRLAKLMDQHFFGKQEAAAKPATNSGDELSQLLATSPDVKKLLALLSMQ